MESTHRSPQIKAFVETSFVDWQGKICSVIFFPRCNFRCPYCHNADLVLRPDTIQNIDFSTVLKRMKAFEGWVDGVCITGGEPTLHPCLPFVARKLKERGFAVKLDTNGSNPDMLQKLMRSGLVDYVAMDVKTSLDENSYCHVTQSRTLLAAVKKSVRVLLKGEVPYEFRATVVPTYHAPRDIYRLAKQLNGARLLRIQNFRPSETVLDPGLNSVEPFSDDDIATMQYRVNQLLSSCGPAS